MKKYYSKACEVMHQEAVDDFESGIITEAEMKEYDELCLLKEGESPKVETPETEQRDLIEVL